MPSYVDAGLVHNAVEAGLECSSWKVGRCRGICIRQAAAVREKHKLTVAGIQPIEGGPEHLVVFVRWPACAALLVCVLDAVY